ncbi:MAG: HD domain-containing protein [Lachnospiraceae bacterium]|nr:HD domain-containing protein [Lachnospiraceae bacterium]
MYGLITAGLATHFPEYLEDDERGQKFSIIEQAIIYAGNAHVGRHRKGTHMPYIVHPMETMMITAKLTNDIDTIAAAALHDVVEDTEYTYQDIKLAFGEKIADLVNEESEDKREGQDKELTWRIRKEETIAKTKNKSMEAKKIMLADKLSNLRASRRDYRVTGPKMWDKFNMKDPAQQKWYYTSVLEALSELCDTPQYKEAMGIIREIFEEVV